VLIRHFLFLQRGSTHRRYFVCYKLPLGSEKGAAKKNHRFLIMARSTISCGGLRASQIVFLGLSVVLLGCCLGPQVSANPIPDDDLSGKVKDTFNNTVGHVQDFYQRFINTFTGNTGGK